MWLLMLEAGIALFLLVFIVWWTMPSSKDKDKDKVNPSKPLPPKDDAQP